MSTPLPILETERLLLRDISDEDATEVLALRSNPEVMRFIPRPLLTNLDDALKHIRMMHHAAARFEGSNFAVTLKPDNTMIGIVGYYRLQPENFRSEIGYIIDPKHHGKGIMRELMPALLHFGFDAFDLHSIEAVIDPGNTASEKLLQHLNFVKEAHFRENICFEGRFLDSVHYTLFRSDFYKLHPEFTDQVA